MPLRASPRPCIAISNGYFSEESPHVGDKITAACGPPSSTENEIALTSGFVRAATGAEAAGGAAEPDDAGASETASPPSPASPPSAEEDRGTHAVDATSTESISRRDSTNGTLVRVIRARVRISLVCAILLVQIASFRDPIAHLYFSMNRASSIPFTAQTAPASCEKKSKGSTSLAAARHDAQVCLRLDHSLPATLLTQQQISRNHTVLQAPKQHSAAQTNDKIQSSKGMRRLAALRTKRSLNVARTYESTGERRRCNFTNSQSLTSTFIISPLTRPLTVTVAPFERDAAFCA